MQIFVSAQLNFHICFPCPLFVILKEVIAVEKKKEKKKPKPAPPKSKKEEKGKGKKAKGKGKGKDVRFADHAHRAYRASHAGNRYHGCAMGCQYALSMRCMLFVKLILRIFRMLLLSQSLADTFIIIGPISLVICKMGTT